jgi:LPPG:FO 2-phospho-L-lactate transferase
VRVVALAGGTGSAKLVRGLAKIAPGLTVVANPGDNVWMHGLYVCPDLDTMTYTLAGIADKEHGWGIEHDSFGTLAQLGLLGRPTWFKLGDRDLATHLVRTQMLSQGATLTEVTRHLCAKLGVKQTILPASDEQVETRIVTPTGEMNLQEFWVQRKAKVAVRGVRYSGSRKARPTPSVVEAVQHASTIVFCPANPVTSIGPILAISGMKKLLAGSKARRLAVSPMLGDAPFSGPARELLVSVGVRPDSTGVAKLYSKLVDDFFVHQSDEGMKGEIERLGMACHPSNTMMEDAADEVRLARELLGL